MRVPGTTETLSGPSTWATKLDEVFGDYILAQQCVTCLRQSVCTANRCPCECHGGPGFPGREEADAFTAELHRLYPPRPHPAYYLSSRPRGEG